MMDLFPDDQPYNSSLQALLDATATTGMVVLDDAMLTHLEVAVLEAAAITKGHGCGPHLFILTA
jgi:hypothetical protein